MATSVKNSVTTIWRRVSILSGSTKNVTNEIEVQICINVKPVKPPVYHLSTSGREITPANCCVHSVANQTMCWETG